MTNIFVLIIWIVRVQIGVLAQLTTGNGFIVKAFFKIVITAKGFRFFQENVFLFVKYIIGHQAFEAGVVQNYIGSAPSAKIPPVMIFKSQLFTSFIANNINCYIAYGKGCGARRVLLSYLGR